MSTAVHAGHDLRPEVAARIAVDDDTRRREEDPFTDDFLGDRRNAGVSSIVPGSRSISTGRVRRAVYLRPDDAWGLDVWTDPAPRRRGAGVARRLRRLLRGRSPSVSTVSRPAARSSCSTCTRTTTVARAPTRPAGPECRQPGGQRRHRCPRSAAMGAGRRAVHRRSARRAGRRSPSSTFARTSASAAATFSRWVASRYPDTGCALAIEFKKVFMDEWTGEPDDRHLAELAGALAACSTSRRSTSWPGSVR